MTTVAAELADGFAYRGATGFTRNPDFLFADRTHELVNVNDLSLDDPDLIAHFTESCCWHLALALNAVTEWTIWDAGSLHVFVGNGRWFLDIEGWHTHDEIAERWSTEIDHFEHGGINDWRDVSVEFGAWIFDDASILALARKVVARFGADTPGYE